MTKICIYNGEELVCEYTKVISSRLTDSLSGECTFEFTITSAMASDIRAEHEIRLIGTYLDYRFNIAKIEKSISNGLTICTVTCEHKSYELNNEQFEISEFEFKGNAADALALLLQGTSLKPGECDVTVPVDMKINQKCSRRAALPYTALASTYAAFCVTVKFTLTIAGTVVFMLQKDNSEVIRYPEFFDVGEHTKTYS